MTKTPLPLSVCERSRSTVIQCFHDHEVDVLGGPVSRGFVAGGGDSTPLVMTTNAVVSQLATQLGGHEQGKGAGGREHALSLVSLSSLYCKSNPTGQC